MTLKFIYFFINQRVDTVLSVVKRFPGLPRPLKLPNYLTITKFSGKKTDKTDN